MHIWGSLRATVDQELSTGIVLWLTYDMRNILDLVVEVVPVVVDVVDGDQPPKCSHSPVVMVVLTVSLTKADAVMY